MPPLTKWSSGSAPQKASTGSLAGLLLQCSKGTEETYTYEAPLVNPRRGEIERRLQDIRVELQQTDYKAIKYAEGCYTDAEYAPTKTMRDTLRAEYNTLETEYETCVEYLPE